MRVTMPDGHKSAPCKLYWWSQNVAECGHVGLGAVHLPIDPAEHEVYCTASCHGEVKRGT